MQFNSQHHHYVFKWIASRDLFTLFFFFSIKQLHVVVSRSESSQRLIKWTSELEVFLELNDTTDSLLAINRFYPIRTGICLWATVHVLNIVLYMDNVFDIEE